jgi:hypothetical protein
MSIGYDINLVDFLYYMSYDELIELGNLINSGVGFYGSLITISQNNKPLNDKLHELFPSGKDVKLPGFDYKVSYLVTYS